MTEGARPVEDILSRALTLRLGGQEHRLQVLFIAGNERWRAYERSVSEKAVAEMTAAGKSTSDILAAFASQVDLQLDLLYAYDTDCGHREGVLPPRDELKERIDEFELDRAIRELVSAANPKASVALLRIQATAVEAARRAAKGNGSSRSSSTRSRRGASRQRKSATH